MRLRRGMSAGARRGTRGCPSAVRQVHLLFASFNLTRYELLNCTNANPSGMEVLCWTKRCKSLCGRQGAIDAAGVPQPARHVTHNSETPALAQATLPSRCWRTSWRACCGGCCWRQRAATPSRPRPTACWRSSWQRPTPSVPLVRCAPVCQCILMVFLPLWCGVEQGAVKPDALSLWYSSYCPTQQRMLHCA